ncbi:MAG: antibiotic biosynthesis monooxygenase family protein [Xenococcaceae cyanobacterium]
MSTIAINNEILTVIVIFSVEPEKQQELIDAIAEFSKTVKQQPGFISANIHKSLDGLKVANYAQWRSQKDYENFIHNAEIQAKAAKIRKFNPDNRIYEVAISESKKGTPEINPGEYIVILAEFQTHPKNQPRMIELAKENVVKAMDLPGLISANFHRSLDGHRVVNYGQFLDKKTVEELESQPGFGGRSPYWEGVAINEYHYYEVVLTETAN